MRDYLCDEKGSKANKILRGPAGTDHWKTQPLCDDRPVIINAYLRKNAFHTLMLQNCYEKKLESLLMFEGFFNKPCEQDIDVGEVKLDALETRLKAAKFIRRQKCGSHLVSNSGVMVQSETSCA